MNVLELADARYFRWRMVAVAFCIDFVAVGFFFYSYGVFFKAIAVEFGDSRLGVSLGLTVTAAVGAVVAPLVGIALDRYPIKRIIAVGTTSMAIGFLALSQAQTPLQFYLAIGIFIGFGANAMGSLATAKLVANWFHKRRGMALGIAATGISISGVIMPFVSAALIESFGWRTGFMLYALFTGLIVVPIVLRFVVSSPEEVGLKPEGALIDLEKTGTSTVAVPVKPKGVINQRNFWVMVGVIGMLICCQGGTLTHMVPRLTDTGLTLREASLVLSLCAGFGVFGKLAFGYLGDRMSARPALWIVIVFQIIGQLAMFRTDSIPIFATGAVFFGFGMGGTFPLQTNIISKVFGRAQFGKALGAMRPAMFPVQIAGVPLAGWMYDTTGDYTPAFVIFIGLYLLAACIVFLFKQPATDFDQLLAEAR